MFAVAIIISEHERESSVDAMIRKIVSQQCDLGLQHYLQYGLSLLVQCSAMRCFSPILPSSEKQHLIYCDFIWNTLLQNKYVLGKYNEN